jgi:hypothetical protein
MRGPQIGTAEAEYFARLADRRAEAQRLARIERRLSNSRLLVFVAGLVLAWGVFDTHTLSAWWLAVPVVAFAALVVAHDRVITARQRADRAVIFYERGLARVRHDWMGGGESGERFADAGHPYAVDLDLFGRGSLFELLCTARTRNGEATLADWLLAPATPAEIRARQPAIAELRPRLELREELAVIGGEICGAFDSGALAAWGASSPVLLSRAYRIVAGVLAAGAVATAVAWATVTGPMPLIVALTLEGAFALWLRTRVQRVIHAAQQPDRNLALLAQLLARLECERFNASRLVELRFALDTNGMPPSQRIAQLHRLIHLLDARKNQLFAPLSAPLLWATQVALAIEAWRAVSGPAIRRWLSAVGEMEALSALASYAYEHPDDCVPEITDAAPCFEGDGLGHPLIPESRCVRNDVQLAGPLRLLVVSGSNMSGKSTLLRTIGINAVLALAGAPVRARRLRLAPLAIGASIRIQDSLQDGTSHFYAEITRLRQLMDLTKGPLPLLFLLDEILNGTNSHDRRIGAAAVVRGFVEAGAIGLMTTHDLALAHIADLPAARAANVHFEDHLEDGKMIFDYRMRPGVVEKSNAVALMRAVGLNIDVDAAGVPVRLTDHPNGTTAAVVPK